jgi:3-hydroxyisobutyrate dehydrogenase-like beta-hydroxyacid dehydrogenase
MILANRETDSEATQKRARESNVELMSTDLELCNEADYILSIAPQKDVRAIADRVIAAVTDPDFMFVERKNHLYFLDLNAVSPRTAREAFEHFASSAPAVKVIDGVLASSSRDLTVCTKRRSVASILPRH